MGRRNRKSKRRVNSLLLLLLLTASMLVVSTYAWFSTNRIVTIDGISAEVAAASGIQISLDGEIWSTNITVTDAILDALNTSSTKNEHQWPTKLQPVSTDGTVVSSDIAFYAGTLNADGDKLENVALQSARNAQDSNAMYIAFDLYIKNSSGVAAGDNLNLYTNSTFDVDTANGGQQDTGLEYSGRVGFLLFDDSDPLSATGATVREQTVGSNPLVSIWEPGYNQHIQYVVDNDPRVGGSSASTFETLGLTADSVGALLGGINSNSIPTGNTAFAIPKTVRTANTVASEIGLTDVSASQTQLVLGQNTITKARVYIWLEGQDPDCNDTASTGKQIKVTINLSKPAA